MHYDTNIALFVIKSGPVCDPMSVIVGWLCYLIVSVDDYVCVVVAGDNEGRSLWFFV